MVRSCEKLLEGNKTATKTVGEAVRHSVNLLNSLSTRILSGQAPYEAWSRKKLDVSHIRVFGYLAHMKIPSNQIKKLEDRNRQVINLGKESGTKAYQLYDPEGDRVHISRDVVF